MLRGLYIIWRSELKRDRFAQIRDFSGPADSLASGACSDLPVVDARGDSPDSKNR